MAHAGYLPVEPAETCSVCIPILESIELFYFSLGLDRAVLVDVRCVLCELK